MRRLATLALVLAAATARADSETPGVDPIARYLADLEASRRLPPEEASEALLRERLRAADDQLVRGDARAATTVLFGIVESPRFAQWKDTASYQNAEFLLGRALARGGARRSAERYLVRVLSDGPDAPYFVPAYRALVDLALETKTYARMVPLLSGAAPTLPADSQSELAYVRGRTAYDQRDFEGAASSFAAVDRHLRFYPGAAYFRGLIAARRRQWSEARAAFCEIVDQKDKSKVAFAIDARYFGLKDLARLALGRISQSRTSTTPPTTTTSRCPRSPSTWPRRFRGVVVDVPEGRAGRGSQLHRPVRAAVPALASARRGGHPAREPGRALVRLRPSPHRRQPGDPDLPPDPGRRGQAAG